MFKWYSLGAVFVFVATLPGILATAQPTIASAQRQAAATAGQEASQPASPDAQDILAVITQSRSTNARGYTVTIRNDGSAIAEIEGTAGAGQAGAPRSQQFPAGTIDTKALRSLLAAVGDVSKIPTGGCAKSVSFGTRTQIAYAGNTSGDLQCIRQDASEGNEAPPQASQDLGRFVQTTLGALKINARRTQFVRPPQPNAPQ